MKESLLIAGFGGQGVMTMGQVIGNAASNSGRNASYYPSYGAEQRGGTANCTVMISDKEIGSPIASKLDMLIVMNEPSFEKFSSKVKKGGVILVNSSLVKSKIEDVDVKGYYIPVNEIAREIGSAKVANIAMLGAYVAVSGKVSAEEIKKVIREKFGKYEDLLELNMRAFDTGYDLINREKA